MKAQKSNILQPGNAIFVANTLHQTKNLIVILKTVRIGLVMPITFEENLKYKRDIPLVAYIDFETTAPTDKCLDLENIKMLAVSYVTIFAFQPDLNIDLVIIERSFGQSREILTYLNYIMCKQLNFKDNKTLLQLRDCALPVADKKKKLQFLKVKIRSRLHTEVA